MFECYPKQRKPLPPSFQAIYEKHFSDNRNGATKASGITSRMEKWMHNHIAKDVKNSTTDLRTLELGPGSLNHLQYEPHIQSYDVVEPYQGLMEDSPLKKRITNIYNDIFEITDHDQYQRIISIAVLEHLVDLPHIIAKCGLLLNSSGTLRTGIPNEGTLLWKLGYRLTTGLEFRFRHNLDYEILMQHEHVNTADEIEKVLQYFFDETQCHVLGVSKGLAFYRFYDCRRPNKDKCLAYLKTRS